MAQIDILQEVLDYSLRKFEHHIIGSKIYFSFNNERYAFAELKKVNTRNEFNGVSIIYVSKLFGVIDQCDIYFKDVFSDTKRATININSSTDTYEWFEQHRPSTRDLNNLAEHVERYMNLIGDFGEAPLDYVGVLGLATQAAYQGLSGAIGESSHLNVIEQGVDSIEQSDDKLLPLDILDVDDNVSEVQLLEEKPVDSYLETSDDTILTSDDTILVSENTETGSPEEDASIDNENELKEQSKEISSYKETTSQCETPLNKSKASHVPFKGIFGRFKEKDKKSSEPETPVINTESDEEPETLYAKPFASWNIGYKTPADVKADLYNIDKDGYSLIISGTGEMQNFKSVPWLKYKDQITTVKIENGVTSIGNTAFKSFRQLKSITLPDSVLRIGLSAFEFCFNLETVHWSQNLKIISSFAFSGVENLKEVHLPDSVQEICDYAFDFNDDFVITHKNPKNLQLGAGISYSDFKSTNKSSSNFSPKNYIE